MSVFGGVWCVDPVATGYLFICVCFTVAFWLVIRLFPSKIPEGFKATRGAISKFFFFENYLTITCQLKSVVC